MPGNPIKIGPFTGGINKYSDPTAIGDNEALDITNFDVDIDGSLVSRPPFVKLGDTPSTNIIKALGWFIWTNGARYLICSTVDPTVTQTTYAYSLTSGTFLVISNTFAATAFVQYQNKAWLVAGPSQANPGGSWDPTAGFTAIAAMKKGNSAVVYKERMFIGEGGNGANSNRLYFSNPANLSTWSAADFLDVKSGDGQSIVDIIVYSDTIVIFKENSCYIFAYDTKVGNGQVRVISGNIGIAGKDCVIEYENNLYILHNKSVYSIINWSYSKLNLKVPLQFVSSRVNDLLVPFSLSLVGDRLIVRYYDSYYIWGLKTRIWVKWSSALAPLQKFWAVSSDVTTSTPDEYYSFGAWRIISGVPDATAMYSFKETYDSIRTETINWSIVTKTYDFESPYTFKRIFWWGVDVISKGQILAQIFPISYGRRITWSQARTRTWGQARSFTWARGADIAVNVDTTAGTSGSSDRTFIKLFKSLRFRQVNFKLSGSNDGKLSTAPIRIFAFTIFVDSKAKVVAQVT